jgi:hypothetical protein
MLTHITGNNFAGAVPLPQELLSPCKPLISPVTDWHRLARNFPHQIRLCSSGKC